MKRPLVSLLALAFVAGFFTSCGTTEPLTPRERGKKANEGIRKVQRNKHRMRHQSMVPVKVTAPVDKIA